MQQYLSAKLLGALLIAATLVILVVPLKAQGNNGAVQSPARQTQSANATAIFAGGCFWCVEADFEKLDGVKEAVSGYTGGHAKNPTYKQVTKGGTGHIEAVKVTFDPVVVSYRELVDFFFRHIDPTDAGGQFCDRGYSYTTAIFVQSPDQKIDAEASLAAANIALKGKVVTPIIVASEFWDAEKYHQNYYKKNPIRYRYYRTGCGRDRKIAKVWGKQ